MKNPLGEDYINDSSYFGSIVGRYGDRIAKGKFNLNGNEYTLVTNNGENHLHGGNIGFDKVVWKAKTKIDSNSSSLILKYLSKDMEEGYPGNLDTTVIYKITNDNSIEIIYQAETDKTTIVNLTQHSYFNLSGDFSKSILDHEVQINADHFLPVNKSLIPIGDNKNNCKSWFWLHKPINRLVNKNAYGYVDEIEEFWKGQEKNLNEN